MAATITMLGLVVAMALTIVAPLPAEAQPAGNARRVGVLSGGSSGVPAVEAFRHGLHELGWVEG